MLNPGLEDKEYDCNLEFLLESPNKGSDVKCHIKEKNQHDLSKQYNVERNERTKKKRCVIYLLILEENFIRHCVTEIVGLNFCLLKFAIGLRLLLIFLKVLEQKYSIT